MEKGSGLFLLPQIPDSDLVKRRIGQMVDPMSGAVFIRRVYSPDQQQQAKNKEGDEDQDDEEEEEDEDAEEDEDDTESQIDEFVDDLVSKINTFCCSAVHCFSKIFECFVVTV